MDHLGRLMLLVLVSSSIMMMQLMPQIQACEYTDAKTGLRYDFSPLASKYVFSWT